MKYVPYFDEIVKNSYDLWVDGIFGAVRGFNKNITLDEQKELFFTIVERLLKDGTIKFTPPNELWHEGYNIWDASTEEIMQYLRNAFPKEAKHEDDMVLIDYFYGGIPAVLWKQEDGIYRGS